MSYWRIVSIVMTAPLLLAAWLSMRATPAPVLEFDICIYGATSAGVVAAVAAAREGKSVILLEPTNHIGGMTASGLGVTDYGNKETIGGIAREFYRRVGRRYGKDEAWSFEPSVAESVFNDMLRETKAVLRTGMRLSAVEKVGHRILRVNFFSGTSERISVSARVYIDCTYEGDLMAKAGVSYAIGRESNKVYGETLNGIRPYSAKHQFQVKVDPYVKKGDPSSGLLPLIQAGNGGWGDVGDGDRAVPAYNYRLCLTRRPELRKPITKPEGYSPFTYELVARYAQALEKSGKIPRLSDFLDIQPIPNGKTDVNNNGPISTDYVGMSWEYPDADLTRREQIAAEHELYIRGLLYFLANDKSLPQTLRREASAWGLSSDEFRDNGGWPYQLYVREARRMLGTYVMTQGDCDHLSTVDDSIGLGSYAIDSHHVRRFVNNDRVLNEGDVQVKRKNPYSIRYGSILPRASECTNLLVPVCVSASHVAYSSMRMEPVFMILGQSAALAASLSVDQACSVQDVSRTALRAKLLGSAQVLD